MFSNFLAFGAEQTGQGSGYMGMAVTLIIWGAIFYLFLIRPNKKKQKKRAEMIEALQPGKDVITAGGIKGEVVSVSDEYVVIRVDKGVRLTFTKDSIRTVL
ncbi:preprotein translocase subunit YajC [Psychrilyobacter sp.]|uniref:preprotein translocase subunit YajC n=1 Tax=Psychrilyobacter sp. TaxID=2586924 RepID=UPI00301855D4